MLKNEWMQEILDKLIKLRLQEKKLQNLTSLAL